MLSFLKRILGYGSPKPNTSRLVSVVIGVRNRDEHLRHCLASLACQSFDRESFEVVVVNYGGSDDTRMLVASFNQPNFRYFYTAEHGIWNESRAKNIGIRNATGNIVCMTNGDVLFPQDLLSFIWSEHLASDRLILQLQRKDLAENFDWKPFLYPENNLSSLLDASFSGSVNSMPEYYAGECSSVRRKHLVSAKGFNELIEGWGAADWEIFIRLSELGLVKKFVTERGVFHQYHDESIKAPLSEFQKSMNEPAGKEYREKTIGLWKHAADWGSVR